MEYLFHVDKKVASWKRSSYTIEANSEEEALAKIKAAFNNGELCDDDNDEYNITWNDYEFLDEYDEEIDYYDNGGNPTEELYFRTHDKKFPEQLEWVSIADNTPLDVVRNQKINSIIDDRTDS
jgi:hypothetical protein